VSGDGGIDDLTAVLFQGGWRADFVHTHEATVTRNVSCQHRCKAPLYAPARHSIGQLIRASPIKHRNRLSASAH